MRWRLAHATASMKTAVKFSLLSSAVWILVGVIAFAQTWWEGFIDPATAARLSVVDWGPWVLFSPLVGLLAFALPITAGNWKWSASFHLLCSLGVALAVTWLATMVLQRWLLLSGPSSGTMITMPLNGVGAVSSSMAAGNGPVTVFSMQPPGTGPGFAAAGTGSVRVFSGAPGLAPFPGLLPTPPGGSVQIFGSGGSLTIGSSAVGLWPISARLTLPLYWLIVAAAHAWRYHRLALQRESRAVLAESEVVRARLTALQSQLQPHFLFNSLNAITAFIRQRPQAAEDMVCNLSNLLRSVLSASEQPEIPLRKELQFAERYVAVHRIRFGDALRVEWCIAPEAEDALVPTLLLQPLIENAFEHGLAGSAGLLEVSAAVRDERLILAVTNRADTDVDARPHDGSQLGLRNTRARLETLFGKAYRLELVPQPRGARAEIELPLRRAVA